MVSTIYVCGMCCICMCGMCRIVYQPSTTTEANTSPIQRTVHVSTVATTDSSVTVVLIVVLTIHTYDIIALAVPSMYALARLPHVASSPMSQSYLVRSSSHRAATSDSHFTTHDIVSSNTIDCCNIINCIGAQRCTIV